MPAIYAAALNYRGILEALGPKLSQDPYKAPPQAPILYISGSELLNLHGTSSNLTLFGCGGLPCLP